jgi:HAD superfamily hydrolase (TIGR01509 family)
MLDAVILDLGNVLAFHDNALLFSKLSAAFGTTPDALRLRLEEDVWLRCNTGLLPGDQLRLQLQKNLGGSISPAEFFALWNCHFQINQPMVRCVEALVGRVKLCLLSNTHDQHFEFLRPQLPVLERFDAIVLSYEEGLMKPDAVLYQRALDRLKVVPARAAFFDDVPRYAEGASAIGIHGRVFTDASQFQAHLAELGLATAPA